VSTLMHEESAVQKAGIRTGTPLTRLLRLYLISRRIPAAIAVLTVCTLLLQWAVRSTLSQHTTGATTSAQQISLLLEAAVAAVVSAALHGPFGESERIAGRRLPWLRSTTATLLTTAALGAVYVGTAGISSPSGEFAPVRDTAGLIGIGLLCTVIVGGQFAWVGPAAYWAVGAYADADHWQTPWTWPARPGGDGGAALCAFALLMASLLAITIFGPRQHSRD
jgi:hypothetical protein